MNCTQTQDIIDAYVDDELDLAHSVDIERHLADCVDCARARDARLALRSALRAPQLRFTPPITLERNVRAATIGRRSFNVPRWTLIIGPMAAVLLIGLALLFQVVRGPRGDHLLDELTAAHVRAMQADHLMDIASTDQHTVKPWFEGKLDFAPPVSDFSANRFPLIGGRLDYIDGRTVAALIYRRDKHPINVFIWPSDGANQTPRATVRNGFNVSTWRRNGMSGAAVSDLNAKELGELVRLIDAGS